MFCTFCLCFVVQLIVWHHIYATNLCISNDSSFVAGVLFWITWWSKSRTSSKIMTSKVKITSDKFSFRKISKYRVSANLSPQNNLPTFQYLQTIWPKTTTNNSGKIVSLCFGVTFDMFFLDFDNNCYLKVKRHSKISCLLKGII